MWILVYGDIANNPRLAWLSLYVQLGWPIFPCFEVDLDRNCRCQDGASCSSTGKHPRVSWQQTATTDIEQIKEWLQQWPTANWAWALQDHVVLDVDPRNGQWTQDGFDVEWANTFGFELPATLTQLSGGGGLHLVFAQDGTIRSGKLRHNERTVRGIDIKGIGGYIIVCPSNHASGRYYQWRNWGATIASLPDALHAMINSKPDSRDTIETRGRKGFDLDQWLTEGSATLPGDQRSHLLPGIGWMRERGYTPSSALALATNVALDYPIGDPDHPWTPEDVGDLVNDLFQRYPSGAPTDKQTEWAWRAGTPRSSAGRPDYGVAPIEFRSLEDVRRDHAPPAWLIKGAWLSDGFGMIGGAEKTLKSWTLLNFAVAVASGRPLFNSDRFPVITQGPVVVLTAEGGESLYLDRLDHLCKLYGIPTGALDELIFITNGIAPIDSEAFRDGLATVIEERDPVLIQLDPLLFFVGDEKDAGNVFSMGPAFAALRETAGGRATQVGHHFTKTGANDLKLASLTQAGSREVIDHWFLLGHDQPPDLQTQTFRLRAILGARRGFGWEGTFDVCLGPFNEDTLTHDGSPTWQFVEGQGRSADNDVNAAILTFLNDNPEMFTKTEVVKMVGGARRTTAALNSLMNMGAVIEIKRERPEGRRMVKRAVLGVALA